MTTTQKSAPTTATQFVEAVTVNKIQQGANRCHS